MKFTEAEIKTICQRSAEAFVETFGRKPSAKEQELLVAALTRWVLEPTAPTTRLQ